MKLSSLAMLSYKFDVKAFGLMIALGYGDSHIHCTSRPRVGLWVGAYRALMWSEVRICASWGSLL